MAFRRPLVIKEGGIEQIQSGDILSFGRLNLGSVVPLTILAGTITITGSNHAVDTQGLAANDDLDFIFGGVDGDILILRSVSISRDIRVRDGAGNCRLDGNFTLTNPFDKLMLFFDGANWSEISRSNNG
jgi:hypothetical protein